MNIKQTYITKNACYKAGRKITPKGIVVHSTACPGVLAECWYSRWNKSGIEKAVHAFLDDSVICQHLPWNHRGWHAGGSANNTHIGFEICEPKDWTTNITYFMKAYQNAVDLCVYLCKKYNLTEKDIISHKEGHKKGVASNHGDPEHWWKYFGYDMNKFRADVKKALGGKEVDVVVSSKNIRSTIRSGSQGEDVKYCQERLNVMRTALGLKYKKLNTDGIFGAKTKDAVKAFQKKVKLTADCIVGNNTWGALEIDYGDVNNDGKVDSLDVQIVNKASVGKEKLTDKQKKAADVNFDGKVDSVDAQEILKRSVGK